jgi:hypothetical protein
MAIPSVMTGTNASIEHQPDLGPHVIIEHINQAQAALQNGDIEGANNHLELAKQSLQGNQSDSGQ